MKVVVRHVLPSSSSSSCSLLHRRSALPACQSCGAARTTDDRAACTRRSRRPTTTDTRTTPGVLSSSRVLENHLVVVRVDHHSLDGLALVYDHEAACGASLATSYRYALHSVVGRHFNIKHSYKDKAEDVKKRTQLVEASHHSQANSDQTRGAHPPNVFLLPIDRTSPFLRKKLTSASQTLGHS